MRFSHLFIFQLRSWSLDLGLPDLGSEPDLFDFLIFDLLDLLDLLILASAFLVFSVRSNTSNCVGFARRCNFF